MVLRLFVLNAIVLEAALRLKGLDGRRRQELLIAQSRLSWIIVRPGALTNAARRGQYQHAAWLGSCLHTVRISCADVAGFMLNQLTEDSDLGAAPGGCW